MNKKYYRLEYLDTYKNPCIVYDLIEYNTDMHLTFHENIIMKQDTYRQAFFEKYTGNREIALVDKAIDSGFIQASRELYNQELIDRKFIKMFYLHKDNLK